MAEPITLGKLTDASFDADTLGEFANDDKIVISRLGAEYPSAPMASRLLVENGLLGATPFSTYTAMTASALVDGDYAVVTTDDDVNKNGVYQKINGTWELSPYNPAIQILNKILELDAGYNQVVHDNEGNTYDFAIVNELLQKIAWGFSDQTMVAPNHKLDFAALISGFADSAGRTAMHVDADGGVSLGGLNFVTDGNGAISIQDYAGRTAMHIASDGQVHIPTLTSAVASDSVALKNLPLTWHRKDINHIMIYGQSLSEGSTANLDEPRSGIEISTTQPFSNVMLSGGTRSEPQHSFYEVSFSPLVEQSVGQYTDSSDPSTFNSGVNESPVSAICNEFTRRCLVNTQQATADDFVMAGMASGRGGYSVENLTYKAQLGIAKQHIKDIATAATNLGKTEALAAICWFQGESNHSSFNRTGNSFDDEITADVYEYQRRVKSLMQILIDTAIKECPDQDFTPYVFTYQTEAHRSYKYRDTNMSLNENPIATAQWFTSRSDDRYVLAIPVYALPKNDRDYVHLTNVGAWLMGAYVARAMEHTLHRQMGKWRPLEPVMYDFTDTYCDIEFYVPYGHLVTDDYFFAMQPNAGFDVWIDGVLSENAITSVEITGRKTLRINFSAPQPDNAKLSYCLGRDSTAPRAMGNLRDTHGDSDIVTDPLGNTHNLHNPCVMFNIHKTRGFI